MKKKLLCILLVLPLFTCAQENDFQAWYSFGSNIKVSDQLTLELSDEIRTSCNARILSKNLLDVGAEYSLSKRIDMGLFFRLSSKSPTSSSAANEKTFYATAKYSKKLDRLKASVRIRVGTDEDYSAADDLQWEHREKVKLSYDIKKFPLRPELSAELFFPASVHCFDLSKTRILGGFSWKPDQKNNHELSLHYGWQSTFSERTKKNDFLLCIGYTFSFSIEKKKK